MESSIMKNINEQLERLTSQLTDLDELKEELTQEEYDEMKNETVTQITEFEGFLENHKAENAEAVQKAQEKLNQAKEKSLGIKAFQAQLEGGQADVIRKRISDLQFECFKKKSLTEKDFKRMVMQQLTQLEKCASVNLTQQELQLKSQIQNEGLASAQGDEGLKDSVGKQLMEHGQANVQQHQE